MNSLLFYCAAPALALAVPAVKFACTAVYASPGELASLFYGALSATKGRAA